MNKSTIRILPCAFQEMQSSCLLHLQRERSLDNSKIGARRPNFRVQLGSSKACSQTGSEHPDPEPGELRESMIEVPTIYKES